MFRRTLSRLNRLLGRTDCPTILSNVRMHPVVKARLSLTPLEDRTVPTVLGVSVVSYTHALEGTTDGVFRFTRPGDASSSLPVYYTVGGTATSGTDFTALSGTVTFPATVATVDVTVTITNDTTSELTETIIATITPDAGYTVSAANVAAMNLFDNDAQYVSVANESDGAEGADNGTFRFTRIGDLSGSLTVNYSSSGGTATSGTDFTALSGTFTFAASAATANVAVVAIHDSVEDEDETVIATVTNGTGYTVGTSSLATVTIIDVPDFLPVAFGGCETGSVNDPVVVDVLDLSSDLDGDTLTVLSVTQGANGSVVDNLDGTVTYTPDTDFVGEDSFTYTVEDVFGNESTGTVYVRVTAPVASPTSVWTDEDTPITVTVLDMAFDPDEDELTTTAVTQGTYGTVGSCLISEADILSLGRIGY